jgi:ABC-type transporter Mla subunit MlaD
LPGAAAALAAEKDAQLHAAHAEAAALRAQLEQQVQQAKQALHGQLEQQVQQAQQAEQALHGQLEQQAERLAAERAAKEAAEATVRFQYLKRSKTFMCSPMPLNASKK